MLRKLPTVAVLFAATLLFGGPPAAAQVTVEDRQALLDLHSQAGGDGWLNDEGWRSAPGSECTWFGVTCDGDRVAGLGLAENQLAGEFPEALTRLRALRFAHLQGNALTGSIPASIGRLTQLTQLYLGRNQFSGELPSELGALTELRELFLNFNQFEGALPAEIFGLRRLEILAFVDNDIGGQLPPEIGQMKALRTIIAGFNRLSGPLPAEIGQLDSLRDLFLYGNELTGSIPTEIGQLHELENLQLSRNRLDGPIPDVFAGLSKLRRLAVWGNRLTGDVPPSIAALESIEQISLAWNALTVSDDQVRAFLTQHLEDELAASQTVAPRPLANGLSPDTVLLRWRPIEYTQDEGGYRVELASSADGPFQTVWQFDRKVGFFALIRGLDNGSEHFFRVRSFTLAHANNDNEVVSQPSNVVAARPVQADQPGVVEFFAGRAGASEGEMRGLTVMRLDGSAGEVRTSVDIIDDTTTRDVDYRADIKDVVWGDGETGLRRALDLELLEDAEIESDERLLVDLELVAGAASLGAIRRFEWTILENDLVEDAGLVDISSSGFEPSAASSTDGSRFVAWASAAESNIVGRFFEPDGDAGEVVQISGDESADRGAPDVAYDEANDGFVVVWESDPDTELPRIRARRIDGLGRPAPDIVDLGGPGRRPAVAVDSRGRALVVWELVAAARPGRRKNAATVQSSSSGGLVGRWLGEDDVPDGGVFEVAGSEGEPERPQVAAASDDAHVVVWAESGGDGGRIMARSVSSAGEVGRTFMVDDEGGGDQRRPEIASDVGDSEVVVVWQNDGDDEEVGDDVFARRVDVDGVRDEAFRVNASTDGHQESPRVVVRSSGECLVAWNSAGAGGEKGVFGRLLPDCRLSGAGEVGVASPEESALGLGGLTLSESGVVTTVLATEDRDFGDGGVGARVIDVAAVSGACRQDTDTLCLNGGRFAVEADWADFDGNRGDAQAVSMTTDTGYFWFFDQDNVEAVVKVLDACPVNGHFWVFAGGLTNVAVSLRVTDTQTGVRRVYENPLSAPFQPIQDTAAFTCSMGGPKRLP